MYGPAGIDAGGIYRVLRNLEKTPSERLRAGLLLADDGGTELNRVRRLLGTKVVFDPTLPARLVDLRDVEGRRVTRVRRASSLTRESAIRVDARARPAIPKVQRICPRRERGCCRHDHVAEKANDSCLGR